MVLQAQHEHVTIKRRPVLLAHDQHTVRCRKRMRFTSRDEELVVENPVVLVCDQLVDNVLIFSVGHHHDVLQRIVEVARVVGVDVGRPVMPAVGREVGHPPKRHLHLSHFPGAHLDLTALGVELETLHDGEVRRTGRKLDGEASGRVEQVKPARLSNAGVNVGWGVRLSVRRR